uniref:Uncharacterized protein n=1 Tax=Romanomermis culicivorax TaxID=13658 RepID=A0A915KXR0_ROMCU
MQSDGTMRLRTSQQTQYQPVGTDEINIAVQNSPRDAPNAATTNALPQPSFSSRHGSQSSPQTITTPNNQKNKLRGKSNSNNRNSAATPDHKPLVPSTSARSPRNCCLCWCCCCCSRSWTDFLRKPTIII